MIYYNFKYIIINNKQKTMVQTKNKTDTINNTTIEKVVRFNNAEHQVFSYAHLRMVLANPNFKIYCDRRRIKDEQSFQQIEFESRIPKYISLIYYNISINASLLWKFWNNIWLISAGVHLYSSTPSKTEISRSSS
jgi:hypothetical protein